MLNMLLILLVLGLTPTTFYGAQAQQSDIKKVAEALVTYTATKQVREEEFRILSQESAKIEQRLDVLKRETMSDFKALMDKLKNYSMEQLVHFFPNAPEGHKRYLLEAMILLCYEPSMATCKFLADLKNLTSEPLNMAYDSQQNPYELNRSLSHAVVKFNEIVRNDHLKKSEITFGQLLIASIIKCSALTLCTWGNSNIKFLIEGTHSWRGLNDYIASMRGVQDQPDKKDGDQHA